MNDNESRGKGGCGILIALAILLFGGGIVGLAVGAPYCSTQMFDLSRPVPGDAHHYKPLAYLKDVAAYAGPGARVTEIDASGMRFDGTIDLNADYKPHITYEFEVPSHGDPTKPIGAGGIAGAAKQTISVRMWEPGQTRTRTSTAGGCKDNVTYRHLGMERSEGSPQAGAVDANSPVPHCDPVKLWDELRRRGAPSNAVAFFSWDADDQRSELRIDGTEHRVVFDERCDVVKGR
jgi:hypothetical protein